jgi:hypothetical protein
MPRRGPEVNKIVRHAVIIIGITASFTLIIWSFDGLSKFTHNDSLFLAYFAIVSIISMAVRLIIAQEKGIQITFGVSAAINLIAGVLFIMHLDM